MVRGRTVRRGGWIRWSLGALVAVVLLAMPAAAHEAAVVQGQPTSSISEGDGVKILLRYEHEDSFYAVHVNRRDGGMRIQRKAGDDYHALEPSQPPDFAPSYGEPQQVVVTAVDRPDGAVELRLEVDGQEIHRAVDEGQTDAGSPIRGGTHVGLRSDNAEWRLDRLQVHTVDAGGDPTGAPLIDDAFERPDGLITNQRIQSVGHADWLVTSGSLFADDDQAWSGVPDDVRPDPESRWSTNSSTFRMITHRDDLEDVAVSFDLRTMGYVERDGPDTIDPPTPPPYPTGTGEVSVDRLDGRSHAHVAIAVSQEAFPGGASDAVLLPASLDPEIVAAPALAGAVDGPILLTSASSLHPDTADELTRLGVDRVHTIGDLGGGVVDALRSHGHAITSYAGSDASAVAAEVAEEIGSSHVALVTTDEWRDAISFSGAAASTTQPILLTSTDALGSAAADAIGTLDVDEITLLGNDLAPSVIDRLWADGITVHHAGHDRYSVARAAADRQLDAGDTPGSLWLSAGARPFHALAGGPAAAADGSIHLLLDGANLGDTSLDDLAYQGYESRHWTRQHRRDLDRLVVIGPTDGVSDEVVEEVREPVRTIIAGMSDIAGTTHEEAIVRLLDAEIAGGFEDGTYGPNEPVTRGQMATFLMRGLALEPGSASFDDVAGTTHEEGIGAVAAAGIAGGFEDGTYGPNQPVTRGQMAAFLDRALDLG